MKFNPLTKRLYTDDRRLIKQLYCPRQAEWSAMEPTANPRTRTCTQCQHPVLDTACYSGEELLELLAARPESCLKVNLHQPNLTVTPHDLER